jgi:hypothetical protein
VPFAGGLWGVSIKRTTATAREVAPRDCAAPGACGEPRAVALVPHSATHLRMTELPRTLAAKGGGGIKTDKLNSLS